MRRGVLVAVVAALASTPAAHAGSLPEVSSGELPGPAVLYAGAPAAPQLENRAPFRAAPLLVSGSEGTRDGEYLYQDYLFDDRGADTIPLSGRKADPTSDVAASTAGDVPYPPGERYAGNAADIVEVRVRPTAEALVWRITLNTAKEADAAAVVIGLDVDRSGSEPVAWPDGAGLTSPGLDHAITAFGTGGRLRDLRTGAVTPLDVAMDLESNQMTVRVPRAALDPGGATWRAVAGAGLWNPRADRFLDVGGDAPNVYNLAFRFDEPLGPPLDPTTSTTFPGIGNWFEDGQARALAGGTSGRFAAHIDFAALAAGTNAAGRGPEGANQARIYPSSLRLPEGVRDGFPSYGGQLQPYLLHVPPGYDGDRPIGLTFTLHSLGGTYTQHAVFSPRMLDQFGTQRDSLAVTPLAHGTDGWYDGAAASDVFQVWADLARHFTLDSERVAITGYSMGGRGTYKLATRYPDLFGRAFTAVGPPARSVWTPPGPPSDGEDANSNRVLESARWVPFMNWVEAADQLVPVIGPRAQQARFTELGLRSTLWTFGPGEHFTLALLDRWGAARDFLGRAEVVRDPWRVDYAFMPAADAPELGLMADHAYWVSRLRARDPGLDRPDDGVRAVISARSLAFGRRDAPTQPVRRADVASAGPPQLALVEGLSWSDALPRAPERNALLVDAENLRSGVIDGRRARLRADRPLRIRVRSDGPGSVRVTMPLRFGARAAEGDADVDRDGARLPFEAGVTEVVLAPGCADGTRPAARFRRPPRPAFPARREVTLRGRATDRGCGPGGDGGRVAGVEVSIQRVVGRGCRIVGAGGSVGRRTSCSRREWIAARGVKRRADTRWRLAPGRLPRGRYVARVRAVDVEGNRSAVAMRRFRVR